MQAKEAKIIDLFSISNTQFLIPVYQRNYNWEEKQCEILLNDILDLSDKNDSKVHFIGSIVYLQDSIYTVGKNEYNVVDGQQRFTTLTLLLVSLYHKLDELGREDLKQMVYTRYLTDQNMNERNKMKLIPAGKNAFVLQSILEKDIENLDQENNFVKNYRFFYNSITSIEVCESILIGIQKLIYVGIALEKDKDDAQRIFESLNSTGLDLSQADLIRNFILMDIEKNKQDEVYENIWVVIEENTKHLVKNKLTVITSEFIRDYLTLKFGEIPTIKRVYEFFKEKYSNLSKDELIDELRQMKEYSDIYKKIMNPNIENNKEISIHLNYIKQLDLKVIKPFLMGVYSDYKNNYIDSKEFIRVLKLLQSYMWRRYICEVPTNSLNTTFANLYFKIDREYYYESIENILLEKSYPDDKELRDSLKNKAVYKDRKKLMYLFERLEYENHNEVVDFSNNITIEHIFPQKPNQKWKENLSEKEYEKMGSLKHTIANLTITGSNSNLGNSTFKEKRDKESFGYTDSKFIMNRWLSKQDEWNLNKLDERFEWILNHILKIWTRKETASLEDDIENIIFICTGPRGHGRGIKTKKGFRVFKGSKASFESSNAKEGLDKIKQELVKSGVLVKDNNHYLFKSDYDFTSVSKASGVILGRSSNGWDDWKTDDGKLLSQFRDTK